MSALSHERDQAFALAHEGLRLTRLGNLILRDGMLTAAERDVREVALIECYDRQADPGTTAPTEGDR